MEGEARRRICEDWIDAWDGWRRSVVRQEFGGEADEFIESCRQLYGSVV